MRMSLDMELRGWRVDIDLNALPPEHDVGLMGWGSEDEIITDYDTGLVLDWELTEDEIYKISGLVSQNALDGYFDDELFD